MRPERRVFSSLVVALTTLAVIGCSPATAPPPAPTPSPTATPPAPKVSDLSGCEELDSAGEVVGAWVVAVPVDLTLQTDRCHARIPVPSKRVCVRQGGAIVWVVGNRECNIKPADPKMPALEISEPTAKPSGKKLALKCTRRIDKIFKPLPDNVTRTALLVCPVPEDADIDRYEYSVGGEVVPDDPDIEVRRGG